LVKNLFSIDNYLLFKRYISSKAY
jgi:hypothetical protein